MLGTFPPESLKLRGSAVHQVVGDCGGPRLGLPMGTELVSSEGFSDKKNL